ncbi:MAG: hypothetical protein V2J13_10695, partial [Cycloclasticus sp.]|nr:hypothetical protein [Cycloclasticus sp.]
TQPPILLDPIQAGFEQAQAQGTNPNLGVQPTAGMVRFNSPEVVDLLNRSRSAKTLRERNQARDQATQATLSLLDETPTAKQVLGPVATAQTPAQARQEYRKNVGELFRSKIRQDRGTRVAREQMSQTATNTFNMMISNPDDPVLQAIMNTAAPDLQRQTLELRQMANAVAASDLQLKQAQEVSQATIDAELARLRESTDMSNMQIPGLENLGGKGASFLQSYMTIQNLITQNGMMIFELDQAKDAANADTTGPNPMALLEVFKVLGPIMKENQSEEAQAYWNAMVMNFAESFMGGEGEWQVGGPERRWYNPGSWFSNTPTVTRTESLLPNLSGDIRPFSETMSPEAQNLSNTMGLGN